MSSSVNLGAGGFVSYLADGGATVEVPETEQEFEERGVGTFISEQYMPWDEPPEGAVYDEKRILEIRDSGNPGSAARGTYYPGVPTFFEQLATRYDYPLVKDPIEGEHRHSKPLDREDMPTPQELADARKHALGAALIASDYGPETAVAVGELYEDFGRPLLLNTNSEHRAMDKRNNAVGASLFKQAGIGATPAQLAQRVDAQIFKQLEEILKRPVSERKFKSGDTGMDLYFPRDQQNRFQTDH